MSCCAPGAEVGLAGNAAISRDETLLASRDLGDGSVQTVLNVPDAHCGACITAIETTVGGLAGVETARLNLSTRRLTINWRPDRLDPSCIFAALAAAGYRSLLADPAQDGSDPVLRELLIALAVAGFAAGNIMLLSVSVWSGAEGATRDLFHWVSALIALPAIAFAGRPFFRPALAGLRARRLNMDVPISLGVTLAALMSLYETATHGPHAYFDAAVTLLFFLLVGRTLDHFMRERARSAVRALGRLAPGGAVVVDPGGSRRFVALAEIRPGMRLHVPAGERLPVDAVIRSGAGELDFSIVNGESAPVAARPGLAVPAGVMNLSGPIEAEAKARAADSFVAEMVRMMEAAESSRAGFRQLADRMAQNYAPVVHIMALGTFLFWLAMGAGWHMATLTAITVLIITCPCALALAVPIVQVVAAGRLFRDGVMVRSGAALEKLADADRAVFDKTGTLTAGRPVLVDAGRVDLGDLALAATLARASRHPFSQAIAAAGDGLPAADIGTIREIAGCGLEGTLDGRIVRLGQAGWAAAGTLRDHGEGGVALAVDGSVRARFDFADALREGAAEALAALRAAGIDSEILSGDEERRVAALAGRLKVARWQARATPAVKLARLAELAGAGHRPLMVGDGINDAPALAAAHVSFAPASAADVGRSAADFVFLKNDLRAIPRTVAVARRARRFILENFGLAIAYNLVAVPIAMAGYATPLIAAVAMSSSSILVTLNALRLNLGAADRPGHATRQRADATLAVASGGRRP
ncbi:MAG: copper-translocating P-type ATPase [Alphaproteobacteria bacterium]|nr:MAG: copper-translocating P-type ATPase [Alphaproteobacteria bacterium]